MSYLVSEPLNSITVKTTAKITSKKHTNPVANINEISIVNSFLK